MSMHADNQSPEMETGSEYVHFQLTAGTTSLVLFAHVSCAGTSWLCPQKMRWASLERQTEECPCPRWPSLLPLAALTASAMLLPCPCHLGFAPATTHLGTFCVAYGVVLVELGAFS